MMICTVVNNVNKTFALRYIAITDGYIASNEELRIISKVKKMDSLSIKVYKVQLFSFCCIIDLDHESQAMRFKEFKSNRFFLLERKLDVMKRIQVAEAILDAFQCFIL